MPIRLRLAALFAFATLVLVGAGGYLFVHSLRNGLETSLDTSLRTRADTIVQRVADASAGIDSQETGPSQLLQPRDAEAQILDPAGRVVEFSEEAGRRPLVDRALQRAARSAPRLVTIKLGDEHLRVLATAVNRPDGPWTVIAAGSLTSADTAVSRVTGALVIGGAVAIALAGVGAWLLASAALRPVERMRRRAADISERDAVSRLPVPSTRDEVAALAVTMNELLARLQGALAKQQAFVADAGHELRTPLAVLRTELELAGRPRRSREELVDAIRNAVEETDRLARLAEELLFLARSDQERPTDQYEIEPVLPVLTRSIDAFRTRANQRDVTLTLSGGDGVAAPLAADDLRRAIDNLLDNALRFAPPLSEVRVAARPVDGDVVIDVTDHGPGFPEEFLPQAFERFRRADDSRSRADGGSGLGLAIVAAVAREHGGTATAANAPNGGAIVTLRLAGARNGTE